MGAPGLQPSDRWLFGPLPDLLFGCGLLYALVFAAHALAGPVLRGATPHYLLPLCVLLFSAPHYGGTLLRVYEQRHDRRAYALFAVWFTLALAALFLVALRDPWLGSLLFTLYLTWSPWHYSGQNYGLAVMFLRRRGAGPSPAAKRWLQASFVLSYLLAAIVLHIEPGTAYSPLDYGVDAVRFVPIGIDRSFGDVAVPLVGAAYLASLVGSVWLLRRNARWSDLLPTGALALTQALWFAVPFAVHYSGWRTGLEPLDQQRQFTTYVLMIVVGHALQYLWITSYYARASEHWSGFGLYWLKVAAAGIALWQLPMILLDGGPFAGGMVQAGSLALLVATFVNLHHFVLDGAIWKLRHSRIAGVLIRSVPESAAPLPAARPGWLRRGVWTLAGVGLVGGALGFAATRVYVPSALERGELAGAAFALDLGRLGGLDDAALRGTLLQRLAQSGDVDAALRQAERLVAMRADGASYTWLGRLLARRGDAEPARDALESALEKDPPQPEIVRSVLAKLALERGDERAAGRHYLAALRARPGSAALVNDLAWLLATVDDPAARDPKRAVALGEGLVERAPDANHYDTLAAAYAADGRLADAVAAAEHAVRLAEATSDAALLSSLRGNLSRHRRLLDDTTAVTTR